MTRLKSVFIFLSIVIALTGCSSLPDYAAPKFKTEIVPDDELTNLISYRKLERSDFEARQPPAEFAEHGDLMAAVTCVYLKPILDPEAFDVQALPSHSGKQYIRLTYSNVQYRALMDRDCSWWNSEESGLEESYILEHEQIHFALFELEARRLREVNSIQFDVELGELKDLIKDVKFQVEAHWEKRLASVMAENRKFDEETSVGYYTEKQARWWDFVQTRLQATTELAIPADTVPPGEASKINEELIGVKLLAALAELGHSESQFILGKIYFQGKGVTQDKKLAIEWLKQAAGQGYIPAQSTLGAMYLHGLGVAQNYVAAFSILSLAAEKGDAEAQTNLGLMFFDGKSVPQDYASAFKWWKLAAGQGEPTAQVNLGRMFALGIGVDQDFEAAFEWYKLAAEQGDARGQASFGWLHHMGRGVRKDNIRAFMWLTSATSIGLEKMQVNLDVVRAEMSTDEIAESGDLLTECRARNFKDC